MTRNTMLAALVFSLAAIPAAAQVSGGVGGGVAGGVDRGIGSGVSASFSGGASSGIGGGISGGAAWSDDDQDRENELYDDGSGYIDEGKWDKALEKFDQVAKMNGKKADAALYYKAYAQNKLGRKADSLATISEFKQKFPKSKWLDEAKALEIEERQSSGQQVNPNDESNCELKLIAIHGLQNMDAKEAVPMLEKFLEGGSCPKLGSQALFVLAQMGTPDARAAIVRIAKGESHPQLQQRAIQDLGLFGGSEGIAELSGIYAATNDVDLKKQILRSFMVAGARDRVLAAAKGEKSPELRAEAIRQLGVMGATQEIWQIYQSETDPEVKSHVIQALFVGGASDKLSDLAHNEKDPDLRRKAIRALGLMGKKTGPDLLSIYGADKDPDDRKEVLNALFLSGDAHDLIEIARKETDPDLKKAAVSKLSLMNSKEATQFLMELLNK